MLWAAHCVFVAALSSMEIRAIELSKKRLKLQRHSSHQSPLHSADPLSPLPSPSPLQAAAGISSAQLKRQLLAHLIDFPLAARSAGMQVTCQTPAFLFLRSSLPSPAHVVPDFPQPFVSLLDDQSAGILGIVSSVLLWTISPA
jgi:hypothetical protein